MIAGRTYLRRRGSYHNMPAVAALPYLDLALCKYFCRLDIFQKRTVSLLMVFLNGSHQTELLRQLRESFFFRSFGKPLLHTGPLKILPRRCSSQIRLRITDAA